MFGRGYYFCVEIYCKLSLSGVVVIVVGSWLTVNCRLINSYCEQ